MADRDLTPAAATHDTPYGASDARAEVEAFMGEGYEVDFIVPLCAETDVYADASRLGIRVHGSGPTYRAAVSALKAAWRDAVRPWVVRGVVAGTENVSDDGMGVISDEPVVVARVLKEDYNGSV